MRAAAPEPPTPPVSQTSSSAQPVGRGQPPCRGQTVRREPGDGRVRSGDRHGKPLGWGGTLVRRRGAELSGKKAGRRDQGTSGGSGAQGPPVPSTGIQDKSTAQPPDTAWGRPEGRGTSTPPEQSWACICRDLGTAGQGLLGCRWAQGGQSISSPVGPLAGQPQAQGGRRQPTPRGRCPAVLRGQGTQPGSEKR